MGKRGRSGDSRRSSFGSNNSATMLREEKTGKKDQSSNQKSRNKNSNNHKGVTVKFNDRLKIEHLERLSSWAAGDANVPSLAAFYGQRLAAVRESLGVPPNPSLLQCERCETVLRPGTNCTVAPKKNKVKARQTVIIEKPRAPAWNHIVYYCHFCSHRNLKKETPKRHSKETCPSEIGPEVNSLSAELSTTSSHAAPVEVKTTHESALSDVPTTPVVATEPVKEIRLSNIEETPSPVLAESTPPMQAIALDEVNTTETSTKSAEISVANGPATPAVRSGPTLLDAKKRKRKKPGAEKTVGPENDSASGDVEATSGKLSKRKRRSWTSLKEIADSNEQAKKMNIYRLPIPFSL